MTVFRKGQKVEIYRKSKDEEWDNFMVKYLGRHGIVVDPDTSINDPDTLVEVSIDGEGTCRLPQDCLRVLESSS